MHRSRCLARRLLRPQLSPPSCCSVYRVRKLSSHSGAPEAPRTIKVVEPPPQLENGFFERPVPVLFLPWECRGAQHWSQHMDFLALRGVTSAAFDFREDGLKEMEAQVVAVVKGLGFTPPVIVARSIGAFVAQRYLQSQGASGVVLVDPFPPRPAEMAAHLACAALRADAPAAALARLTAAPARCEPALRRHFLEHIWQDWGGEGEGAVTDGAAAAFPFPVRAFAEMADAAAGVRLEPRSVAALVVATGMTELAAPPDAAAAAAAAFHDAPLTWVTDDRALASTLYAWYDKNF